MYVQPGPLVTQLEPVDDHNHDHDDNPEDDPAAACYIVGPGTMVRFEIRQ